MKSVEHYKETTANLNSHTSNSELSVTPTILSRSFSEIASSFPPLFSSPEDALLNLFMCEIDGGKRELSCSYQIKRYNYCSIYLSIE